MPPHGSGIEREIKLALASAARGRALLRRHGFRLIHPRAFEVNLVFDREPDRLRAQGKLLRLRRYGRQCVLTYKGAPLPGRHKTREEIEFACGDFGAAQALLDRLGYRMIFRYEKYRSEFTDGRGAAMLDDTPIGAFLELEGAAAWIDGAARRLGYGPEEYITASYGGLYLSYCGERGVVPGHMTFAPR